MNGSTGNRKRCWTWEQVQQGLEQIAAKGGKFVAVYMADDCNVGGLHAWSTNWDELRGWVNDKLAARRISRQSLDFMAHDGTGWRHISWAMQYGQVR